MGNFGFNQIFNLSESCGFGNAFSNGSPAVVSNGLVLSFDTGNPASYSGGSSWTDTKSGVVGTLYNNPISASGGLFFNGSNTYVATPNTSLTLSNGFTLEAVVKFTSVSGNQGLVAFNSAPNAYMNLLKSSGAGLRWEIDAGQSVTGVNNLVAGKWYHFTGVWDKTNAILYRNGVVDASAARTCNDTTVTAPFELGRYSTDYFNGKMIISRFYSRPLTPTEVLQNYNATAYRLV
jgi:Concanavalin A-like lectin/glucanases superfamily